MPDKNQPSKPKLVPVKEINPEMDPAEIPAIPLSPEEEFDIIPDDEFSDTPTYEAPEPGEGP